MANVIRILIADDHQIVRAGIAQFIADQGDMQVTGEAATSNEAVELERVGEFDIVVLGITMPEKNDIDCLRILRQVKPELTILVLSGYPEAQYAVNLLRSGANG